MGTGSHRHGGAAKNNNKLGLQLRVLGVLNYHHHCAVVMIIEVRLFCRTATQKTRTNICVDWDASSTDSEGHIFEAKAVYKGMRAPFNVVLGNCSQAPTCNVGDKGGDSPQVSKTTPFGPQH
jgi:hypothetical protein